MIIVSNSRQEEEEWIRGTWRSRQEGTAFVFGIELLETDQLIGTVGIHGVDWINRMADYGIALWSSKHWNQGFGTEATRLLLKYAFEQLNLNRIELRVFAFNKRAKAMYEKVGFQQVGVRRQSVFRDGAYHDEYTMDYLSEDWKITTKIG